MYIERAIEKTVREISTTFPVLLLTGPRQCGKTTMLKYLAAEGRNYVTMDDPDVRKLARNDPSLFMQRYTPPVIIDEIQYAPEILPYIKMYVDNSGKMGEFWLTGSQLFHSMKNVTESMAGRVGIVQLAGLSSCEISGTGSEPFTIDSQRLLERLKTAKKLSLQEIFRRIWLGSMPALYANDKLDRDRFWMSYVDTYLKRDIADLTQVADESAFLTFMEVAAAHTGKPVVYQELALDAGISAPTAKKWLSLLVSSQLAVLIEPYHNNVLKRAVKMPLLHFKDTGLCAYLLKWNSPQTLERGAMSGALFESWVFSEIYKSSQNAGHREPVFYYRDKDRNEIDLILEADGKLHPIEIKKSANPGKDAIAAFRVLSDAGRSVGSGGVVCCATEYLPFDANNSIVPWWMV